MQNSNSEDWNLKSHPDITGMSSVMGLAQVTDLANMGSLQNMIGLPGLSNMIGLLNMSGEIGMSGESTILNNLGITNDMALSNESSVLNESGMSNDLTILNHVSISNEMRLLNETAMLNESEIPHEERLTSNTQIPNEADMSSDGTLQNLTDIENEEGYKDITGIHNEAELVQMSNDAELSNERTLTDLTTIQNDIGFLSDKELTIKVELPDIVSNLNEDQRETVLPNEMDILMKTERPDLSRVLRETENEIEREISTMCLTRESNNQNEAQLSCEETQIKKEILDRDGIENEVGMFFRTDLSNMVKMANQTNVKSEILTEVGISNESNISGEVKKLNFTETANKKNISKPIVFHKCNICGKGLQSLYGLKRHMRQVHECSIPSKVSSTFVPKLSEDNTNSKVNSNTSVTCNYCDFKTSTLKILTIHLERKHQLFLDKEILQFETEEKFNTWKMSIEKESNSAFIKKGGRKKKDGLLINYFYCQLGKTYVTKEHKKRRTITEESSQNEPSCPAQIKAWQTISGYWEAEYIKTHLGHPCDSQLPDLKPKLIVNNLLLPTVSVNSRLNITHESLNCNVKQIASQKPRSILRRRSFNVIRNGTRHNANWVTSWVKNVTDLEEESPVVFFKCKGKLEPKYPSLQEEDFLLVVMNRTQREMLKLYGNDVICNDSTYGVDGYNFELTTLLVLDNKREGFPAVFILSNKQDENMFSIAFEIIKEIVDIHPVVFMSDGSETLYNAWRTIFGDVDKRLLCTWGVDKNWKVNLGKCIVLQEEQINVYKILQCLLSETDEEAFKLMINEAISILLHHESTQKFGMYFRDNYGKRPEVWAYCYRKWAALNTNLHIERMCQAIRLIYFEGKKVKRLDKSLRCLMKFVTEKRFDSSVADKKINKLIQIRHDRSRHLFDNYIVLNSDPEVPNMQWNIKSRSEEGKVCCVLRIVTECLKECPLICKECEACLHNYICTCSDNSIQWNMCVHVHLVCQALLKKTEYILEAAELSDGEGFEIMVDQTYIKKEEENQNIELINNKAKLNEVMNNFCKSIDSCGTVEECQTLFHFLANAWSAYNSYNQQREKKS